MAELSGPWDDSSFVEADWAQLWSIAISNGVADPYVKDAAGNKLSLRVYSDGQGRQVRVSPGSAIIRGHLYRNTAEITKPVAVNTTGSLRYDLVVLRLDTASRSVSVQVRTGVAGSTQVPNAVEQVGGIWEVPLAHLVVPNNFTFIPPGNVVDQRAWLASAAEGARWRTYAPTYVADVGGVVYTPNAAATVARYLVVGSTCFVTWTSNGSIAGSGNGFYVGLPMKPQMGGTASAVLQGRGATGTIDVAGSRIFLARSNSLTHTQVPYNTALDAQGNGFIDLAGRPYAHYVSTNVIPADPATNGYPGYPKIQALPIVGGASTRLVFTNAQAGLTFSGHAMFMLPDLLPTGALNGNAFTAVYPIADGA